MEQIFTLYTWQLADWDITKEKRDPSKGILMWHSGWEKLQLLYKRLEQKTGSSDFIWCFSKYEHWKQTAISRLWVLNVPTSKIFKFLDHKVWDTMREDINNDRQPDDTSWDKLILGRNEGIKGLLDKNDNITPLVRVPLCTTVKIINKDKFNIGPYIHHAEIEDLPASECEAKRCRDEGYNWQPQREN